MPFLMPRKVPHLEDEPPTTVELDLEGFTPSKADTAGIAVLLKHMFENSPVNSSDLAEYVVQHSDCGTVVKPSVDDEDPDQPDSDQQIVLAVTTVIDISVSEGDKFSVISSLRKFIQTIVSTAPAGNDRDLLLSMMESNSTSHLFLLLNERFENLPLSVCADAVAVLPSEITEAKLSPTHLLLISRAYRAEASGSSKSALEYAYPEFEQLKEFACASIEVTAQPLDETDFNTYIVLLVQFDRLAEILDAMRSHL